MALRSALLGLRAFRVELPTDRAGVSDDLPAITSGMAASGVRPHTVSERLSVEDTPWTPEVWTRVAPAWRRLYQVNPAASFFLHPNWVDSWLDVFAPRLTPRVVVCRNGHGAIVGAALMVAGWHWRGPIPFRRLHLNTDGEARADRTCAEFNMVLCDPGWTAPVSRAVGEWVRHQSCDEFVASGVTEATLRDLTHAVGDAFVPELSWSTDHYVDLQALRSTGRPYVDSLSRNARGQLARSARLYERRGAVSIRAATSETDALRLFDLMVRLHEQTWQSRGQPGAFTSPRVVDFHRRLLRRGFADGSVHLLHVCAGSETIAVLYEFVERGRVYFYQSGIRYDRDNRHKPGLLAHALAIEYWRQRGSDEYDFLAGEEHDVRYKRSLSTHTRRLAWVRFQRPGLRVGTMAFLKRLKRAAMAR